MDRKKLSICINDGTFKIVYALKSDVGRNVSGVALEWKLYDLPNDPDEWTNLADTKMYMNIRALLGERVQNWIDEIERSGKMADLGPRIANWPRKQNPRQHSP